MTGRYLASRRHEIQFYPGKVDWARVIGFGLAVMVGAAALFGRAA